MKHIVKIKDQECEKELTRKF